MSLKHKTRYFIFAIALGWFMTPTAQGQCKASNLEAIDEINTLVIDARPSEINKVKGKTAFKKRAEVTITNMNPFMYKYDVIVEQTEIADTAALDFIKLLGAPITDLARVSTFAAVNVSGDAEEIKTPGNLGRLIRLTDGKPPIPGSCSQENSVLVLDALKYLADVRQDMLDLKDTIDKEIENLQGGDKTQKGYRNARAAYTTQQDFIYSPTSDAQTVCLHANTLFDALFDKVPSYPQRARLNKLKADIAELDSLINELTNSATAFKTDPGFTNCQPRHKGFNYAESLLNLANAMSEYRAGLEKKAQSMTDETKAYDLLVKIIKSFDNGAGGPGPGLVLLQKKFSVHSQYDISALDIKLASEELEPTKPSSDSEDIDAFRAMIRSEADQRSVGSGSRRFRISSSGEAVAANDSEREPIRDVRVGVSNGARFERAGMREVPDERSTFAPREAGSSEAASDSPSGSTGSNKIETKAKATIGARRFELSGGMVFANLGRTEFKPVLGYARNADGVIVDADGKPTDKRELTKIVGFTENSKRRFAPLVMLHTRLTNNSKYNLFFSTGVTGKNDTAGFDVEYFLGPSINFLNRNVFLTFGGYAGKQQKLAGDLFVGARLGDNAVEVKKQFEWKPGFSFTYRIPVKDPAPSH